MPETNENLSHPGTSLRLKIGLAEMLKGGVIMDVMSVEQARIAEEAGAASVMALERVPAMIRARPTVVKGLVYVPGSSISTSIVMLPRSVRV